ncbi:hypothetical protein ZWY2020_044217 [Hordeum vulgare]|nr:hypothetical protein ZWY2020_044217 [Hordeum vulgare]
MEGWEGAASMEDTFPMQSQVKELMDIADALATRSEMCDDTMVLNGKPGKSSCGTDCQGCTRSWHGNASEVVEPEQRQLLSWLLWLQGVPTVFATLLVAPRPPSDLHTFTSMSNSLACFCCAGRAVGGSAKSRRRHVAPATLPYNVGLDHSFCYVRPDKLPRPTSTTPPRPTTGACWFPTPRFRDY